MSHAFRTMAPKALSFRHRGAYERGGRRGDATSRLTDVLYGKIAGCHADDALMAANGGHAQWV
jgi:hypothetical protein